MLNRVFYGLAAIIVLAAQPSLADVVPIPAGEEQDQDTKPELQVGKEHLRSGNLDEAENAILAHLQTTPDDSEAMLLLAEVLLRKGDLEGAGARIREVIQLEPDNALAHRGLARYHFLKYDFETTLELLQRAIELDPQLFAAHIDVADYYLGVGNDLSKATAAYETAVEINPKHGGARFGLGVAHERAGNYAAAEDAWRYAALLEPANPLPMYTLGSSLMAQDKTNEAFAAFSQALKADPRHIASMLARGRIYASRGESDRALREFNSALAVASDHPAVHLNVALVKQQIGDEDAAIKAYKQTLMINDQQPLAHNNLAWLLAKTPATLAEALRHAQQATELQPRVGSFWDTLGWIQHLMGDNEAAKGSLERAISLEQNQVDAYEHLAKVHAALGDDAEAAAAEQLARSLRGD